MRKLDLRTYLVLDPDLCGGLDGMLRVSAAALAGGAGVVQLRAPEWKKRDWLLAARKLQALCRAHGALFIVNDHIDVALAVGADGVHIGQADLPPDVVRRLLGPDAIIGLSVSHAAELGAADASLIDYFGVGPVFATATKPDAAPPLQVESLAALVAMASRPCIAIGGIHLGNAREVLASGVAGVAVVSAICAASDPEKTTREFLSLFGTTP
ncbi:thiamine phosphate synthase [Craterilacuibacter sp.]|uniref:thiamine phosphate synthase n=1 Tax=Craterilacuibacter sp. TaxID=2870909 RepID=UPI003F367546